MKNILLIILFSIFAFPAIAQMVVIAKTNMKFGSVSSSVDGSGTVTISPTSDTTTLSGTIFDFGGTVKRGKFKIENGTPKAFVTIILPPSITITKGSHTLTVDQLTLSVTNPVKLNNSGKKVFYVGGRLSIPTNQKAKKNYNGDYTVTAVE